MYSAIMYAINTQNRNIRVDFLKSDDKYVIEVWNKVRQKTVKRIASNHYKEAENAFNALCGEYDMDYIKEVKQTWTAEDFD